MSIALTNGHGPQIGDPCSRPSCSGTLRVDEDRTRIDENARVKIRYLHCGVCGANPPDNVQVVPLRYDQPTKKVMRKDIPMCPDHDIPMTARSTQDGTTYCKCPHKGCEQTDQYRKRVVVP